MSDLKESNSYELANNTLDKRVEQTTYESPERGNVLSNNEWADLNDVAKVGFTQNDQRDMLRMGKKQEFRVRVHKVSSCSRN